MGGTYRFENGAVKEANPAYSRDGRFSQKCELTLPASYLVRNFPFKNWALFLNFFLRFKVW